MARHEASPEPVGELMIEVLDHEGKPRLLGAWHILDVSPHRDFEATHTLVTFAVPHPRSGANYCLLLMPYAEVYARLARIKGRPLGG